MKKILSLAMASAMALSIASTALAADATYKVGAIEGTAYAYDKDLAAVDLRNNNADFTYGDTLYYPLISTQGTGNQQAINQAKAALEQAKAAKTAADQAFENAKAAAATAASELEAANAIKGKTDALLSAANDWAAATAAGTDETVVKAAFEALAGEFEIVAVDSADAVAKAGNAAQAAATLVSDKTTAKNTADGAVSTAEGNVTLAQNAVVEKTNALNALSSGNFKYVYEYDAVRSIKIKQSWDNNGKLVSGVEIVKKKAVAATELAQKYVYFVAVSIKDNTSTSASDVNGTIQLRKSGEFDYAERQLEVAHEIGFTKADDGVITATPTIFSEGNGFSGDVDDELTFDVAPDSFFTVNTTGQGKLLLAMNARFDSEIAARFPEANLDFLNGNGASFNKTGVMSLAAPEGSYIYKLNADGSLTAIKADYDKYEETYNFKTRTLDRYVISDVQLKNTGVVSPEEEKPVIDGGNGNNNPSTGAAL